MNTCYWATSDFQRSLEVAAGAGMAVTAHLGDWGHTYRRWKTLPRREGTRKELRKALAEIGDREEVVRQFLKFTWDGIETLAKTARGKRLRAAINHGIALAPKGAVITKGPRWRPGGGPELYSFTGQAITDPGNLREICRQLDFVKENGIEMRCCPTVNVRSQDIRLYRGHPLYEWIRRGIKVSLNVDDLYWFADEGTTLSDDVAKAMLAGPEWFTVAMAKACCCADA